MPGSMATPLAPGFSFSGRHRLSYGQIKDLAEAFGLPGNAIAQIAMGESSRYADIQQRDPGDGKVGYGLLQMTPNAWGRGSAAYRYMQKLGGVEAMRDPVKNMAMARFLYKSAGNKLTPWYGTKFLRDRSGEGTLGPVNHRLLSSFGSAGASVLVGGASGPSGGGGGTTTTVVSGGGAPEIPQGSQGLVPLLQALGQQQAPRPSGALPAPAFSAAAVMPGGYKAPVSAGGPAPKQDMTQLMAAVQSLQGGASTGAVPDVPQVTQTAMPGDSVGNGTVAGTVTGLGPTGRVRISPTADRPGVSIQPIVTQFLGQLAGRARRTITVGTGTRHNRMTTSGNVSDHWDGHASDLPMPVDSEQGDMVAAHALEVAGVPWSQAVRMAQQGGLWNVRPKAGPFKGRRVQVIWKTNIGGNHHNHVHIGIR